MTTQNLYQLLQPTVEGLGYELWGIVYLPQKNRSTLRIYIDHADGIGVDACEQVSRQVSAVLDVENTIAEAYVLEVSSPGLDRFLFFPRQYPAFVGRHLSLQTKSLIQGRRRFKGLLKHVLDHSIQLELEESSTVVEIEFSQIDRAQLEFRGESR